MSDEEVLALLFTIFSKNDQKTGIVTNASHTVLCRRRDWLKLSHVLLWATVKYIYI